MSAPKTFNVAVVGYGMSAQIFHIPFIQHTPQLTLRSIVQRSPPASPTPPASSPYLRSAPHDHPEVQHHTTLAAALADGAVDVVIVTTPPSSHVALVQEALEAGKHVLVEKPFAPTAAEVRTLAELARAKGVVLCSFNNRRWDVDFLTVKGLIERDELGRIVEFETHFDRFRPEAPTSKGWKNTTVGLGPAQGGGPIFDLGSHLIDQAYVLFGKPASVYGRFTVAREARVGVDNADSVITLLNYGDGKTVLVRVSVVSAARRQPRFWVRGTKGSWWKEGLDPQEDQLIAGMKPGDEGFGVEKEEHYGVRTVIGDNGEVQAETKRETAPAETWAKFYQEFAGALGGQNKVPVTADEAADVLQIIEAALESARTGKEVTIS